MPGNKDCSVSSATIWLNVLSSTSRILEPLSRASSTSSSASSPAPAGSSSALSKVSSTEKVVPAPFWLCTEMVPPIRSTSCLEMVRPSPVPPYLRAVSEPAWVNDSKICSTYSGAMPMPVSLISKRSRLFPPLFSSWVTFISTNPFSVNFTALPARFSKIWVSRVGSPLR